jgi:hypothetical protein
MKGIAAAIVLMGMTTASVAEIRCQDAPGREQHGVFWSWREIEGKRCWFVRARGGMPPKSAFTWSREEPAEEPAKEDVTPGPEKTKSEPIIRVRMLRVKPINPEELSDGRPNWVGDLRPN